MGLVEHAIVSMMTLTTVVAREWAGPLGSLASPGEERERAHVKCIHTQVRVNGEHIGTTALLIFPTTVAHRTALCY